MNLGIYSPYQRSETTLSALRLADFALSSSFQVRLLAPSPAERNLHPYWDQHVRIAKGNSPYYWAKGCQYIVWFDHHPQLLAKARLVADKATQCLVPMWHRLPRMDSAQFALYDRVVCPLRTVSGLLVELGLIDPEAGRRLQWCAWDAGVEPVQRAGLVESGVIKLYVPIDSATIDESGAFTLRVLDELLKIAPHVTVTVDCTKSWPRKIRPAIRDLVTCWRGRLKVIYRSSFPEMQMQFHDHDWTFLPCLRANTGIVALQSLACHTPVIAYDVEPFGKLIRSKENGLSVNCDLGSNWLGASMAAPRFVDTLEALRTALRDEHMLDICRHRAYKLDKLASQFAGFWRKEWGV